MSGVKGRSGRKGSYEKQLSKALGLIDRDLPLLMEKLLEKAKNGDREALIYCIDRVIGKPKATTELTGGGGEQLGTSLMLELFTRLEQHQRELREYYKEGDKDAIQGQITDSRGDETLPPEAEG